MKVKEQILLIGLFSLNSYAFSTDFWVRFGAERMNLKRIESGFVNGKCKSCDALKLKEKTAQISKEAVKFKNPYALACKELNGKVRIGKLYSGHQQSFCFSQKDSSFISTNLLKFELK
jgi:hypothetical protein